MKFRNIAIVAIICCICAFAGCSETEDGSSESSSNAESTSSTITSVVTVTDDEGNEVTDNEGQLVTSVVTIADNNDDSATDTTTTAPFVTSVSETIVTQNITVTDSQGEAVTDTQGNTQTEVITSVSQVVVTVKSTTTAKTTTTSYNKATTTKTVATTTAVTTTSAPSSSDTSTVTNAQSVTTAATTTTTTPSAVTTTTTSQTAGGDVTLKISDIDYPSAGDCFGTVSIPKVGIEMDLYMSDTNQILRKGIGMYMGSYLPGYENRTIMCGHNSAGYLADWVDYAKANDVVGEQILISTTYGDYVYEIYKTEILDNSDTSYFSSSYSTSTLILYSCMESDYTNERIYFIAKKLSGPVLVR